MFFNSIFVYLDRVWTDVKNIDLSKKNGKVLVRARVHTSRGTGERSISFILPSYNIRKDEIFH